MPHHAAQDHGHDDDVVELADHRQHVGHEVERHGEVPGEQPQRDAGAARHPLVPREPHGEPRDVPPGGEDLAG